MLTRRKFLQTAALATVASTGSSGSASAIERYGFFATAAIAEAAFIYGLPIVVSYAMMYEQAVDRQSGHFKAPFNRIKNEDRVFTSVDAAVLLPNNDTPCSLVWMDLRAEPIILSVPAVDAKRYYSILLRDGRFYNYGYIGSRATGSEAGDYMVVGPDWRGETPSDIRKVFRSSSQFSLALFRTQLFDPADIDNVRKLQAGYELQPLSKNRQQASPRLAPAIDFQKISRKLLRKNFFQHLAFALQFAPAQFLEADADANLVKLGVGPGKTFNFRDLSSKEKVEVILGIRLGDRKIDRTIAHSSAVVNGWRIAAAFGDSVFYNGNWLLRAAAAKANFYGDDPVEAVSPFTEVDDHGRTLDSSKHDYTLTFAPGQLPPVNAFWSLTIYDAKSRLLVKNAIDRYLVNSSMLPMMNTDADGGLTIHIQHKSPGAHRRANWLPAPDGPMCLVLRLYWPKTSAPSILPIGKGTWQPPDVQRAL